MPHGEEGGRNWPGMRRRVSSLIWAAFRCTGIIMPSDFLECQSPFSLSQDAVNVEKVFKILRNDSISGDKPCWTSWKKVSQADKSLSQADNSYVVKWHLESGIWKIVIISNICHRLLVIISDIPCNDLWSWQYWIPWCRGKLSLYLGFQFCQDKAHVLKSRMQVSGRIFFGVWQHGFRSIH